jgi:hypothetical protein
LELYEVQQPVRKAEEHALKLEAKVSFRFITVCPFVLLFSFITFKPFVFISVTLETISACIITVTIVRNSIDV